MTPAERRERGRLVRWATACAEHVLPLFEAHRPKDVRPRRALEAARAYVRGEVKLAAVRASAQAAHAAARATVDPAARAAARAAGQAASVAHARGHASAAAAYAAAAAEFAAADAAHARERAWQVRRLPEALRTVAIPAWRPKR